MAFGRLKERWRRLTKKIEVEVDFAPVIIAACCVLHNIVEFNKEHFFDEWLQTIASHSEALPQPDPTAKSTTESSSGEIIRNALLELCKKLPLLSSIQWRLKRY